MPFTRPASKRRQKRYKPDRSVLRPAVDAAISSITVGATSSQLVLHLDSDVLPSGDIPGGPDVRGTASPTGVLSSDARTITLSMSYPVTATNAYAFSANDPAFRTRTGGYILPKSGVVA